MPIKKSAQKALKQSKKRALNNLRKNREIKDLTKKIQKLVSSNKIDEAKKLLPAVYKAIDKAKKVNILKKNTAARRKSRLAKLVK
ncbi:MAG TPA: 30S ribosomal protein S20 [Candidatus Pacearchaeota archaeon]|nr:30S ribosomal protein S20 [Candidatus Pacearchaeota archaeon]